MSKAKYFKEQKISRLDWLDEDEEREDYYDTEKED